MFFVVDPGEMCGYMMLANDGKVLGHGEAFPFACVRILEDQLRENDDPSTFVVVERYTITPMTHKMTRQYAALETIGAIRYVAAKYRRAVHLQSRSEKSRVSNTLLISLGWYKSTPDGHANDAARHAFVAMLNHAPNSDLVRRTLGTISARSK